MGFRLKGSGWYETDFKKGNQRNVADSGSDGDSKEAKKESATSAADSNKAEGGKKDKPASDSGSKSEGKKATAA